MLKVQKNYSLNNLFTIETGVSFEKQKFVPTQATP